LLIAAAAVLRPTGAAVSPITGEVAFQITRGVVSLIIGVVVSRMTRVVALARVGACVGMAVAGIRFGRGHEVIDRCLAGSGSSGADGADGVGYRY